MTQNNREIWLAVRDAFLRIVDAIEKQFGLSPTTAELRKRAKRAKIDRTE